MTPKNAASHFVGSDEIEHAVTLVGWIAMAHVAVEEGVDYLHWQLAAFERAASNRSRRLPVEQRDQQLRALRTAKKWRTMRDRLRDIDTSLTVGAPGTRLDALDLGESLRSEWRQLGAQVATLSARRDQAIHGRVQWSDGRLVRTLRGSLDGTTEPLDPADYQQLRSALGQLSIAIGLFATKLGVVLPFAGADKIITIAMAPVTIP